VLRSFVDIRITDRQNVNNLIGDTKNVDIITWPNYLNMLAIT
jgi:hypothetical protein